MKTTGIILNSLLLATTIAAAPNVAASSVTNKNGSCAQAIDEVVASGYRRSTLSCNGAVRSNTWRVHHSNGCITDVTFYNSGDIGAGTHC